jgi:hypothetical protein
MFVSLKFRHYTGLGGIHLVAPSPFQSPLPPLRIFVCPVVPFAMDSGAYASAYLRLQMGSTSDQPAIDIAANPTSDAGTFLPQVPLSLHEERSSSRTPNIPPDNLSPEVNVEAGSQVSCGAPFLHLLTQIFRHILLVSVHQLLFGALMERGHCTLKISSPVSMMKDFLSSVFRTQCVGQMSLGFPRYADTLNLCEYSDLT